MVPRTRSRQKLPTSSVLDRTKPRKSAISTAMPTAADTKFWNVSASIWLRYVIVVSPP